MVWYENLDGSGSFGAEEIYITNWNDLNSITSGDMDGDNDLDLIAAGINIRYFENIDGNGNFGDYQLLSYSYDGHRSVGTTDLDGDNDLDIISSYIIDHKIVWFQNDGQANFEEGEDIIVKPFGTNDVFSADFDNDGDLDILTSSSSLTVDGMIAWYENHDGQGGINTQHLVSYDVNYPK